MTESIAVANRFLDLAEVDESTLSSMQLLKLVYIAHGWFLGLYTRNLIRDEVQAWQYGPVIPRLYNKIRVFKASPVQGPLGPVLENELSREEESIIEQVYRLYGKKSGAALSRMTHANGTPWAQTYVPGSFGIAIPNEIIHDHYSRLAQEAA